MEGLERFLATGELPSRQDRRGEGRGRGRGVGVGLPAHNPLQAQTGRALSSGTAPLWFLDNDEESQMESEQKRTRWLKKPTAKPTGEAKGRGDRHHSKDTSSDSDSRGEPPEHGNMQPRHGRQEGHEAAIATARAHRPRNYVPRKPLQSALQSRFLADSLETPATLKDPASGPAQSYDSASEGDDADDGTSHQGSSALETDSFDEDTLNQSDAQRLAARGEQGMAPITASSEAILGEATAVRDKGSRQSRATGKEDAHDDGDEDDDDDLSIPSETTSGSDSNDSSNHTSGSDAEHAHSGDHNNSNLDGTGNSDISNLEDSNNLIKLLNRLQKEKQQRELNEEKEAKHRREEPSGVGSEEKMDPQSTNRQQVRSGKSLTSAPASPSSSSSSSSSSSAGTEDASHTSGGEEADRIGHLIGSHGRSAEEKDAMDSGARLALGHEHRTSAKEAHEAPLKLSKRSDSSSESNSGDDAPSRPRSSPSAELMKAKKPHLEREHAALPTASHGGSGEKMQTFEDFFDDQSVSDLSSTQASVARLQPVDDEPGHEHTGSDGHERQVGQGDASNGDTSSPLVQEEEQAEGSAKLGESSPLPPVEASQMRAGVQRSDTPSPVHEQLTVGHGIGEKEGGLTPVTLAVNEPKAPPPNGTRTAQAIEAAEQPSHDVANQVPDPVQSAITTHGYLPYQYPVHLTPYEVQQHQRYSHLLGIPYHYLPPHLAEAHLPQQRVMEAAPHAHRTPRAAAAALVAERKRHASDLESAMARSQHRSPLRNREGATRLPISTAYTSVLNEHVKIPEGEKDREKDHVASEGGKGHSAADNAVNAIDMDLPQWWLSAIKRQREMRGVLDDVLSRPTNTYAPHQRLHIRKEGDASREKDGGSSDEQEGGDDRGRGTDAVKEEDEDWRVVMAMASEKERKDEELYSKRMEELRALSQFAVDNKVRVLEDQVRTLNAVIEAQRQDGVGSASRGLQQSVIDAVREQEAMLAKFQEDNDRLIDQLQRGDVTTKQMIARVKDENDALRATNFSLRSRNEVLESQIAGAGSITSKRILELEETLAVERDSSAATIRELKEENQGLFERIDALAKEKDACEATAASVAAGAKKDVERMKRIAAEEIALLKDGMEKLASENSRLKKTQPRSRRLRQRDVGGDGMDDADRGADVDGQREPSSSQCEECKTLRDRLNLYQRALPSVAAAMAEMPSKRLTPQELASSNVWDTLTESEDVRSSYTALLGLLEEKDREISALNDEIAVQRRATNTRVSSLEGNLQQVSDEFRAYTLKLEDEVKHWKGVAKEAQAEKHPHTRIKDLENELDAVRKQLQKTKKRNEDLVRGSEEFKEKERVIRELREECAGLRARLDAAADDVDAMKSLRAKVEEHKNLNKELQVQVEQAVAMLRQQEEAQAFAEKKLRSAALQKQERLEKRIGELEQRLINQERQQEVVDALKKMVDTLNTKLEHAPTQDQIVLYEKTIKDLTLQLKDKEADLRVARKYHTPSMQHYSLLQQRVGELESRNRDRDQQVRQVLEQQQRTAQLKEDEINNKWRILCVQKAQRVAELQEQVEALMSVFRVLRGSGVPIPQPVVSALMQAAQ